MNEECRARFEAKKDAGFDREKEEEDWFLSLDETTAFYNDPAAKDALVHKYERQGQKQAGETGTLHVKVWDSSGKRVIEFYVFEGHFRRKFIWGKLGV